MSSGYMLQRWLRRAVITVLCAILLALPFDIQVRGKKNEVSIIQPRVHILLDVSLSMSADDLQPSRFVAAKQLIQDLAYENDREASLTVFSGIPLVQIPFTADMVAFSRHLDDVRLVDFPPTQKFLGTALGDALLVSLKKASTYTDQQHIILITDGDSSIGLDPLELARVAGEQDIPVHTIAM